MIRLIHDIQILTCKLRAVFVSNEIQYVNEHKKPQFPNQKTEVEIWKRPEQKGRRSVKIDDKSEPPPVMGPMSEIEAREYEVRDKMKSSLSIAMEEKRESLKDEDEAWNNSFVGIAKGPEKQLFLNRRREGVPDFHYRRSAYDIAFAVSITDEIMDLEPIEEKLMVLKRNYEMTPIEVVVQMR